MSKTPQLVAVIQDLAKKVERLTVASRMPHVPRSTIATALLLTGVTSRTEIAELLGVSRQWLGRGPEFEAFRKAESYLKVTSAVSRRSRSGAEFVEND